MCERGIPTLYPPSFSGATVVIRLKTNLRGITMLEHITKCIKAGLKFSAVRVFDDFSFIKLLVGGIEDKARDTLLAELQVFIGDMVAIQGEDWTLRFREKGTMYVQDGVRKFTLADEYTLASSKSFDSIEDALLAGD